MNMQKRRKGLLRKISCEERVHSLRDGLKRLVIYKLKSYLNNKRYYYLLTYPLWWVFYRYEVKKDLLIDKKPSSEICLVSFKLPDKKEIFIFFLLNDDIISHPFYYFYGGCKDLFIADDDFLFDIAKDILPPYVWNNIMKEIFYE